VKVIEHVKTLATITFFIKITLHFHKNLSFSLFILPKFLIDVKILARNRVLNFGKYDFSSL